ncbi:MAG TPA: xanthine dehydrogenase family protein molybdopterin-binding subunit [Bryobacteraceae bacterium]|nr:xanthine dehydrogenase family protein molybdopterin-binding subunit [Bryobacteraceae bacterium]
MKTQEYSVIGTRPIRHDGVDKVTGRAQYGADFQIAGLLHGYVLRSPHAHARIKRIDTSKAAALTGVKAVVTAADFPDTPDRLVDLGEGDTPLSYARGNVLAKDKVLYKGHAVAAVAAVNAHVAEEAAALIEVDYDVLACTLTAPEAMQDNAPILHENLKTKEFGEQTGRVSNIAEHFRHEMGDINAGFADADVVIEREFHTATVHQGYIEPHNATALWNNDGRVLVWCSTQGAFVVRDVTACLLDMPVSRVKVTPMEIGGGFGGKIPVYIEPVAALLSKKSGKPVKIVMSRKDVFEGTGPTPGSYMKVKIGSRKDGRITAAQAYLAYEAGAYPGAMVAPGAMCVFAAYDIPNVVIDGFDVVVNKPSTAAYRAPGATNAAFAAETVIDEIAEKLGVDPLDLRLKNAAKEGTRRADGPKYRRIGCVEVIEAMKRHPHYSASLEGPNRGRGVAVGFWFNVGLPSSCTISVNADGTVNLVEGSTDIGGTRTSVAMQAAEVLGIPAEDVRPTVVDTDSVGFTAVTGGSRTTFATGWAAYEAAQDIVRQMKERAAKLWEVDAASVTSERGIFRSADKSIPFRELASKLDQTGGPIIGRGAVNPRGVGGSFSGNIVDVEVDPETGKVTILRFTAVQDAGKAIHPSYVEGQMQGGSVQGIGWALNEEYYMSRDGSMMNSSLLDYRMPTALDLPMIDTVIVEVPNPGHPFGARGVGEANIVPPPAAIANAIYRAAGVRMRRLPMNPAAIMEAIWSQRD